MSLCARCWGAATIVCGFASGCGAAFGIDLHKDARLTLEGSEIVSETAGHPEMSSHLVECCVEVVFKKFGYEGGVRVKTESNIPFGAGLKSSSVTCNAVVLGLVHALGVQDELSDDQIINLGVDAAYNAGVTATGALDDASAAYYGGLAFTDNLKREIQFRALVEDNKIVILLPEGSRDSGAIDRRKLSTLKETINDLWRIGPKDPWHILTLNGLLHCRLFKQDPSPVFAALEAGALGCGLSGTGPSVVAVCDEEADVESSFKQFEGEIITCNTNNRRAEIL
ncbi:MAG: shikimate kinase [Candidatus Altiarchaeales archaeon]|nr:shikimate kinase [Candidatus Altiarchaeales archaeon]